MGEGTDQDPSFYRGLRGVESFFTADAALELLFHAGFFFLGEMRWTGHTEIEKSQYE